MPTELRQAALNALQSADFEEKYSIVSVFIHFYASNNIATDLTLAPSEQVPGRPPKPVLVAPDTVPKRSVHTRVGRAGLVHAVAHIEWNAINLALDAIWRFDGMPVSYYRDWAKVAFEEAKHFQLLRELLQHMGHDYGDFPAHDGLWEMTEKTANDITARMALVPRTLEARGLDATPIIQAKLKAAAAKPHNKNDPHAADDCARAVEILDIILTDEIGHVAIGNHWYRWLCEREGVDAVAHYAVLAERYAAPKLKAPFNVAARLQAGFSQAEIAALSS